MSGNPPQHKDENKSGFVFEDKLMIVYNRDVKEDNNWHKFIKTYNAKYKPLTTFLNNKTLIFKSGALWQLEFFLNLVFAYPLAIKNIYTESEIVLNYLTVMAKKGTQNNIELANHVGFKLILYTNESFLSEFYTKERENVSKSITSNTLNSCSEYVCVFKYDDLWKIILPTITKEKQNTPNTNTNFWNLEPGYNAWNDT